MTETERDNLESEYLAEIRGWNWKNIKADCKEYIEENDDGEKVGHCFLGTVFSIYPSGKYWTCFASSNVNEDEVEKDTLFTECLEVVAEENGGFIYSGEDDPCDLFFGMNIEEE